LPVSLRQRSATGASNPNPRHRDTVEEA
jgi:hypothetical protein